MAETTLTDKVLDTLVNAGLLTMDQLSSVREASADGTSVASILRERGLVTPADVGSALEDELGVPRVDLSSYTPDQEALDLVPGTLARERRMLPLFEIDGTLTVAVGDPMDVLALDDVARTLSIELDPVLADPTSLLGAIMQYYGEQTAVPIAAVPEPAPAPAVEPVPEEPEIPLPPSAELTIETVDTIEKIETVETIEQLVSAETPVGPATIDLDVLAVADSTRVALLVTDILNAAAARGASRIHLLPYKDDFFLVYRVKGRLEKIASAPLSLQGALVEGFKNFARVGTVAAGVPAMGRVRTHLADQDLVLTVSVVPTIAGQRAVISLVPFRPEPRGLASLGMSEAEARALHAMVERGRGILLIAAPVAEGRSSTYYSLLAHAASVGKTAYSVERAVEYELPAVAQVLVNPGSPIAAAAYLAAGIRQDTDVVAIDGMSTVADIQIAVEAAGAGRLVIATFAAGDIVAAIRRMLDLGAEPYGLAAALTLAVGQRLVRTNCPNCTVEKFSETLGAIPGVTPDMVNRTGTGCPNCGKTGFGGTTGIFEVLPFTDPVRAAVARGGSVDALHAAARAAGMRPLVASGLARVAAGVVSSDELDRVLRLSK